MGALLRDSVSLWQSGDLEVASKCVIVAVGFPVFAVSPQMPQGGPGNQAHSLLPPGARQIYEPNKTARV
jgi:hypothetical protein